ncbi:MAG: hypothetical protein WC881_09330 [Elusimicrobiota bacterium]|jgi:hypothetical protein
MKIKIWAGIALVVVLVLAGYGGRQWLGHEERIDAASLRAMEQVLDWPTVPHLVSLLIMEKYGAPQVVTADKLEWYGRWPWKRIVVRADEPLNPLEQVVDYYLSSDNVETLSRFPHGLRIYADKGELGACSDREELNRMALNLANDIVTGRKTPEQASKFFLKTADLSVSGKSSPYMDRMLFEVTPPDRLDTYRMMPPF